MAMYRGPCERCGEYLERDIRPGRKRYHIECACQAMAIQHVEARDPNGRYLPGNIARGREHARQAAIQGGEWYEKYRKGLHRYLIASFPLEATEPDTVTPDQSTP